MKLSQASSLDSGVSSREIRAATARLACPADPLAEWRFEFEEWRAACAESQQMEQSQILGENSPAPLKLRQHRCLLFQLMSQGEYLALCLEQNSAADRMEHSGLLDQVEAFLGTLRDSWHTWHGEALPAHRQALAKFLA
ncbi:MAG: hypothetical protein ABSC18_00775 [Verrucomicrobiota bacterium]|jgi:hypothetical protein